jgi:hypothetical protein
MLQNFHAVSGQNTVGLQVGSLLGGQPGNKATDTYLFSRWHIRQTQHAFTLGFPTIQGPTFKKDTIEQCHCVLLCSLVSAWLIEFDSPRKSQREANCASFERLVSTL